VTTHIVWDWNGTLFDDFAICVEAASHACRRVAGIEVDAAGYRRHFTRPVRAFYERLLGRPISEEEWRRIAEDYHAHYGSAVTSAGLRAGALEALRQAHDQGITQSLLSMSEHDALLEMVGRHELERWMVLVQGSHRTQRTESKRTALRKHLAELTRLRGGQLSPESVLLVGDTLDDAEAAAEVGARCVLLADGCYDPATAGLPVPSVVATLSEAVCGGFRVAGAQ
jgi:phosphoglycolate phosphatase-like HAD superfamily hydrolase